MSVSPNWSIWHHEFYRPQSDRRICPDCVFTSRWKAIKTRILRSFLYNSWWYLYFSCLRLLAASFNIWGKFENAPHWNEFVVRREDVGLCESQVFHSAIRFRKGSWMIGSSSLSVHVVMLQIAHSMKNSSKYNDVPNGNARIITTPSKLIGDHQEPQPCQLVYRFRWI